MVIAFNSKICVKPTGELRYTVQGQEARVTVDNCKQNLKM